MNHPLCVPTAVLLVVLGLASDGAAEDVKLAVPPKPGLLHPAVRPQPLPPVARVDPDVEAIRREIDKRCALFMLIPYDAVVLVVDRKDLNAHHTIQSAVDAAKDNNYIYIRKGVYRECVDTRQKPSPGSLTAPWPFPPYKKLHLFGQSRDAVIVEAPKTDRGTVIEIGNGSSVENLTVRGGTVGAAIASGHGSIAHVLAENNRIGIDVAAAMAYSLKGTSEIRCCLVRHNRYHGVSLGSLLSGADVRVRHNRIHDNGLTGIILSGGRLTAECNLLERNGATTSGGGTGISIYWTRSAGTSILRRNAVLTHRTAVLLSETDGVTLERNVLKVCRYGVLGTGWDHTDNERIDLLGNKIVDCVDLAVSVYARRARIENNLIVRGGSQAVATCCKDLRLRNNTIVTAGVGMSLARGRSSSDVFHLRACNNILVGTTTAIRVAGPGFLGGAKPVADIRANLFWKNAANLENVAAHVSNQVADPRFTRPAWGDYRLRAEAGSPAIDTGAAYTPMAATDAAGNPRKVGPAVDRGAYEHQGK
jgi:hypothetical protein